MGIPDHLTFLLRNLYTGQEATVRTGHGTTDCFQIEKGVHQGCILSPCLFNLYAEYIMRNRWGNSGNSVRLYFGGSKITADSDCRHEIKRCLLLGRKVMTNRQNIKKQRHYFVNKGPFSQGYGFSSGHVWM